MRPNLGAGAFSLTPAPLDATGSDLLVDCTAEILDAIASGRRLPAGDYGFVPPLVMHPGGRLLGDGWGHVTLTPLSGYGDLIRCEWTPATDSDSTFGLRQTHIEGIRINGLGFYDSAGNIINGRWGIKVNAPYVRIRDVEVLRCERGIELQYSVDNVIESCSFRQNTCDLFGNGPSITTTRVRYCQLREATWAAAYVLSGYGLTFDDNIFESNRLYGLIVTPGPNGLGRVGVHGNWFESNGIADVYPDISSPLLDASSNTFIENGVPVLHQ